MARGGRKAAKRVMPVRSSSRNKKVNGSQNMIQIEISVIEITGCIYANTVSHEKGTNSFNRSPFFHHMYLTNGACVRLIF